MSELLALSGAVEADAPDDGVAAHYGALAAEQRRLEAAEGFVDLSNRDVVAIAGPDRLRFDEVIRRRLRATNDPRTVVADTHAPYFGSVPTEDSLVPLNGATLGAIHFADWLKTTATP